MSGWAIKHQIIVENVQCFPKPKMMSLNVFCLQYNLTAVKKPEDIHI